MASKPKPDLVQVETLVAEGKRLMTAPVVVDRNSLLYATQGRLYVGDANLCVVEAEFAKGGTAVTFCMWGFEFERVFGIKSPGDSAYEDKDL